MKNKIFFILSWGIFTISIVSAQTIIPGGNVSGTWTAAGSPYNVHGNITVHTDSTLTIEPSAVVNFEGSYTFNVNGFLQAIGTVTDSIHFTAGTTWGGITFTNAPDSSHLDYCTITDCQSGIGAGIYCINSNPIITHCIVSNNSGAFFGAIALDNSNPFISNCTISNNKGYSIYGSGISMIINSSPEISYCNITGNGHSNSTGTIYCGNGSSALISHCMITRNEGIRGGGIFVDTGGNPVISNSTISDNIAYNGGGIYFSNGSSGTISDCIINADSTTNASNTKGGGILISSSSGKFIIRNSTISNCWSAYGGSGVHIDDADSVLITGTIFENNVCTWEEGSIYSANCANLLIDHCNFVKNRCNMLAGGITLNGNTNLTLTNSIFRNQVYRDIIFANYSSASVSYCNFYGSLSGPFIQPPTGLGTLVQTNANGDSCDVFYNIYLDPLFVDFAGGDYHLTENSPCIDAGDPASPLDPDNTVTDMGCYFFDQRAPFLTLSDSLLNFGSVFLGNQADLLLTFYNTGSDTLLLYNIFSGSTVFLTNWNPAHNLILPADSMEITVTFTPQDTIPVSDTLHIENNHQLRLVLLTGEGMMQPQPVIALSDTLLDFGSVLIGQSADSLFTIYNLGSDTLTINNITNNHTAFSTNYYPADSLIMPGDSLAILITFTPADTFSIHDTLFIYNNDQNCQVKLIGVGQLLTGISELSNFIPKKYALRAAYPNPFNSSTTLEFDLPKQSFVILKVYNILGEEVSTLISKEMATGRYKYVWNANNQASGIYFYILKAGEFNKVRKIILLR